MNYHFKIVKEKRGYSEHCLELEGCVTEAQSKHELFENMREALNLYLDEPADSKSIFSMPGRSIKNRNVVQVPVEPRIAFAFALRMTRLKHGLTQKMAAHRIGIKGSLNNYQRLENSSTANPVLETLVQIRRAFPDFPIDQITS